jgi:hypothetical protein
MAKPIRFAVRNPEGYRTVVSDGGAPGRETGSHQTMAPRLEDLRGKIVYLVDTGFGGSGKFLDEMQAWLAEHMPAVTTVRRRKTGHVFGDDTKDLWAEIHEQGQAAVLGIAG